MALTDEDCSQWVEFGGRGRQKPPNLLPKQTQFGYASLNELWSVVFDLLRDHPEVMRQPRYYHISTLCCESDERGVSKRRAPRVQRGLGPAQRFRCGA